MLVLAASLVLSTPDAARPTAGATAHAQAIIRIVSGVRVRFDAPSDDDAARPRDTEVRGAGPELLPARLVEFE